MKPMLARTYGPRYSTFPAYVQPKLNGVRALYQMQPSGAGVFQSRDEHLWPAPLVLPLLNELDALRSLIGPRILDGEFYVHNWRLQRINGAIALNRNSPCEDTLCMQYHIFDVVDPKLPFSERWLAFQAELSTLINVNHYFHIRVVPTHLCYFREEVEQHFHRYTADNYEGVMLRPDGPYDFGITGHGTQKRSKHLWKYKQWEDDEFVCVGTTRGEGKADIGIGALVCASRPEKAKHIPIEMLGKYFNTFKVGTGFSDEDRIEYMRNPPIGKLVRVRYLELTADGIPFNPSFLAVLS